MDFHGEFAIMVIMRKLREVCDQIVVVTGHRAHEVVAVVETHGDIAVTCVVNPEFERGMFSSIRTGVRELPNGCHFFLQMVDQPHVPQSVYRTLIEAMPTSHDVLIPTHAGRRGHPLLFRSGMKAVIASASPDSTLRDVLHRMQGRIAEVEVDTDAVLHTINTPADQQFITTHYS